MFVSINPFTTQIIAEFRPLTQSQIKQKLEKSSKAFGFWKSKDLLFRLQILEQLANLIEKEVDILAVAMVEEMGKTITEARAEILKCAIGIRFFIEKSPGWLEGKVVASDARFSGIQYQPLGGVLLVMPWNFPLWQVIRASVPALCLGNVILLKHAPNVFRFSLLIESLFQRAGFPEGVFENFMIEVDDLEQIVADGAVAAVSLTGSEKAGRSMAALAGKNLKKCVLELGGSDPFIVMPDADLAFAAGMAAKARLINNGQSCIAAKRFLIHASVEIEFLELLKLNLSTYLPADPLLETTLLGPQARPDLVANLKNQLNRSLEAGAEMVFEMNHPVEKGYFFQPTVLRKARPGMACFDEEIFGPIAAVSTFKNLEEAIMLANTTRFGLGASIYTRDEELAKKMALEIDCGTVAINAMVRSKPSLPFGGIKASGYGRELSEHGLYEFSNLKTITVG
jgi:succinate-semialdehyde dehydrogenase/glutarate-semialdehyde dehydrogenase